MARLRDGAYVRKGSVRKSKIVVDFSEDCDKIIPVMRDMKTYTLYWKNEDTNRVSSKDFTSKPGVDHSAMDEALELAQEADTNMWPWILEEDGCTVAHGWGGDMLGAYRFQG
jgi:hypothetical protein